jgi:hypothetical protein
MRTVSTAAFLVLAAALGHGALSADEPAKGDARKALQPFHDLIGQWKGTGTPAGPGGRDKFWTETLSWGWRFKGPDAWLRVSFDKSKHFIEGELRYLPDKDVYQLTLRTPDKEKGPLVYTGPLKERTLTLERQDPASKGTERLVFRMLHSNRFVYYAAVKRPGGAFFSKVYDVGATKKGVPFAEGDGRPECIVSGGLGTMPVTYMGETYYVCCSGCRTEFNANPAKYVREYKEKQAKKKNG